METLLFPCLEISIRKNLAQYFYLSHVRSKTCSFLPENWNIYGCSIEWIHQSKWIKKWTNIVIEGLGLKRAFAAVRLINSRINFHNGLFMIFQLTVFLIRRIFNIIGWGYFFNKCRFDLINLRAFLSEFFF